jgi:hypothetical protein
MGSYWTKAVSQDRHSLHPAVPLAAKNGTGPQFGYRPTDTNSILSGLFWCLRSVQQAPAFSIEVSQTFGLQPIS